MKSRVNFVPVATVCNFQCGPPVVRQNCEVTGGRAGLCLTSDEMRGMEVWGENVVECVGWNMFVTPRGPVEGV